MVLRVAAFLDHQNVYNSARRAMGLQHSGSHIDGQINPLRLGLKLKGLGDADRELCGVYVYRGRPSPKHDPGGQAACDRQVAAWTKQPGVFPITRPLNYRDPAHPREKGVDVKLAIDFVMMANDYDVGVLFSEDTDLLPALEAVLVMKGAGSCEVATWRPVDGSYPTPLRVPGQNVPIRLLTELDYAHVHDPTDYTVRTKRR